MALYDMSLTQEAKSQAFFSHPGNLKYGPWWKEVLSAQVNKIP